MGIFMKLVKGAVDTVSLPVDVARDVVSLGGALDEKKDSYTEDRLRKIKEDAEKAYKELEED